MLLRLAASPADWDRLAAAVETIGSPTLANFVRAGLAFAPRAVSSEPVALDFTPAQAGALQQVGAALGLTLLARPVMEAPAAAGWVALEVERAEAVAAAEAIVRAHQRRRVA